jgi:hypothetical protein
LGGTIAVLIIVTFPALLYIKTNNKGWYEKGNIIILIFAVILTLAGYIAAFLSLLKASKIIHI